MSYNLLLNNGNLSLLYNDIVVMENITIVPNITRQRSPFFLVPICIKNTDFGYQVSFTRNPEWGGCDEIKSAYMNFNIYNESLSVSVDIKTSGADCVRYYYTFNSFNSLQINFKWGAYDESINLNNYLTPYWLKTSFNDNSGYAIASISERFGDEHVFFMATPNDKVSSEFYENGLSVHTNCYNTTDINATVMGMAFDEDPFKAINKCVSNLSLKNEFPVLLKDNKVFPEKLNGLGWCTWDAFYKDVDENGIIGKLEELKSKNIKLKWILIDDGWFLFNEDKQLCSFGEDKRKFPNGLKKLISVAKEKYGVESVGVWHAFTGYWKGIAPNSEIERENSKFLFYAPSGEILPGETYEKSFGFWDKWHTYLQNQGVDFVKVDNQAVFAPHFDNVFPGTSGLKIQHQALEDSVRKHFGGTIINCMGSNISNILNRTYSCINRTSDDYFPNKPNHFSVHAPANVYISPFQNNFYICDFDMFWTKHTESVVSAVLRAVSGGPIYISDKVGHTDGKILSYLFEDDGSIPLFDGSAIPTLDCYYTNCNLKEMPLKVFNRKDNNFVMAAFNISPGKTVFGEFSLGNIPDTADEYYVHDYFSKKYFRMDKNDVYRIALKQNECALLTLYPIINGVAKIGDTRLFAEGASGNTKTVKLSKA